MAYTLYSRKLYFKNEQGEYEPVVAISNDTTDALEARLAALESRVSALEEND